MARITLKRVAKRFRDGWSVRTRLIVGYLSAVLAVLIVSGVIDLLEQHEHIANVSLLYLIAVLAVASIFGSGPAILASLAAFLSFNFLFVEPVHTLYVADPAEWVALLLFLTTAVVTGQLAAGQRRRAQEAEQREREAVVLYDVARLLGETELEISLRVVAARLREELHLAAVVIEIDVDDEPTRVGDGDATAIATVDSAVAGSKRVLGRGASPSTTRRGSPGRWVRVVPPHAPHAERSTGPHRLFEVPVETGSRRYGTIFLMRQATAAPSSSIDDRLLSVVATQLGAAVERLGLRREAMQSEVLRATDELKTALLNAVSHDLRTPLASIIASAGSLKETDVTWSEAERREFAEAIEQEAQRLNRLVGNLLDLSRIEAGHLKPERSWHDLASLVDDVLLRLRPVTIQHVLVIDVPGDLPPAPLDYVHIDQVLSNLVENAAKYTPARGEIRVSARRNGGEILVEVADSGPGIPEAALPRLFDPFFRVTGPQSRPGAGVGLAVARGLVEAHGGRIWVENRPSGGARFSFILPLQGPRQTDSTGSQAA
ncbi:MAG: histidine kinase [Chloroflexi bacterium]|nr:histidine kinase [Chloroflexota bacterium]